MTTEGYDTETRYEPGPIGTSLVERRDEAISDAKMAGITRYAEMTELQRRHHEWSRNRMARELVERSQARLRAAHADFVTAHAYAESLFMEWDAVVESDLLAEETSDALLEDDGRESIESIAGFGGAL